MAGIDDRIKSIIVDELGVEAEEVTLGANFENDLGADSLDLVELKMSFEEEFGIEIPDAEANKVKTVGEAIKYLDQKVKQ
jgi:acyl carrier protein